VLARDMVVEVPLPEGGSVRMPGNPIKLSDAGPSQFAAPPPLGAHTVAVLKDFLGYDAQRISELARDKVVS